MLLGMEWIALLLLAGYGLYRVRVMDAYTKRLKALLVEMDGRIQALEDDGTTESAVSMLSLYRELKDREET